MITRFWAGFFGAAPLANVGGALGDMFPPQERALATMTYSVTLIGGPTLGPLIGRAMSATSFGWRGIEYTTGMYMTLMVVLDTMFIDESYSPVLLEYKARILRFESGNWALHACHEEWDISIRGLAEKYLLRPFQLLTTPICFLVSLYSAFVFGMFYANLSTFPIEFEDYRHWSPVVAGLPFLAILAGVCLGAILVFFNHKYYIRCFIANQQRPVPEARLPSMMVGGIVFTAGMFILAWTSSSKVYWASPVFGGAFLIGFAFFAIFQASINFLVDTFQEYAASAIAANTFFRCCFGAAFPLFITYEIDSLHINWGLTVFACFAVLLIPIPFVFFQFGKTIRARGKWSESSV